MTALLSLYNITLRMGEPALNLLLRQRLKKGKEDAARLDERKGIATRPRPSGKLLWIHAASVGESQSALVLIDAVGVAAPDCKILVTTGTVTSAALMQDRLPAHAFHQYAVIDHPAWVDRFLNHWQPDLALWMESELWPNTLLALKRDAIPAILVNARLSDASFATWSWFPKTAKEILGAFPLVLTQTQTDAQRFKALGADNVYAADNIKFSASPLPCDKDQLAHLQKALSSHTPIWVFASTHAGEEEIACNIHNKLKKHFPNILTIVVPRHPHRRDDVVKTCQKANVPFALRSASPSPNFEKDGVYIVDTMGELGLFYSLATIAVIGRSFSLDGGGGHNPIEAAQMGCVVLTGPNNQFQRPLYDDMTQDKAVIEVPDETALFNELLVVMSSPEKLEVMRHNTKKFLERKSGVIKTILAHLMPFIQKSERQDAA